MERGQGLAAREGHRRRGQARGPRGRPGRDRSAASRATSARSSSSTARPTSSPRATCSSRRSPSSRKIVVEQGDDRPRRASTIDGETVDDFVKGLSGTLGEKIELGRVVRFEAADGLLDGYKHIQNERGVVGVLVELGGVDAVDAQGPRGRARHRAAHRERRAALRQPRRRPGRRGRARSATILEKQTAEEGKPEQAWPKIVEGKLNGFFKTGRRSSSSRSSRTRSRRSAALVAGARRRRRGPALRTRQDRRGLTPSATIDRRTRSR